MQDYVKFTIWIGDRWCGTTVGYRGPCLDRVKEMKQLARDLGETGEFEVLEEDASWMLEDPNLHKDKWYAEAETPRRGVGEGS